MRAVKYKEIFEKEWSLYRKNHPVGEKALMQKVRFGTLFDGGVQAGEIRLFADAVPPRMGFVREAEGGGDWQVIPISEFTVPANDGEALVGARVYQFWNARALPKSLVSRSWVVSVLSKAERNEVESFYLHQAEGRKLPKRLAMQLGPEVTSFDARRLEYECEFVMSEASFDYVVRPPVVIDPLVFVNIPIAYAADDPESKRQSCMVCNEDYFSCTLDKPFVSLRKDTDPGVLVFSWSKPFPKAWHVGKKTRVTLHDRASRRQIGEGRINLRSKEVVIDRFDGLETLEHPVEKACDAVIVLTTPKGK